jgi:hypothetical protein
MSHSIQRTMTVLIALCLLVGTAAVVVLTRTGQSVGVFAAPQPGSGCASVHQQLQKKTLVQQKICWPDLHVT